MKIPGALELTVPLAGWVKSNTASGSPSTSKSLASTLPMNCGKPCTANAASATATGGSFTGCTRMNTVPSVEGTLPSWTK